MTALLKDRATSERSINRDKRPVAAAVKCIKGGLAAMNATGFVQPATGAIGNPVVGYFYETVDNAAGAAGAKLVDVHYFTERVIRLYANDTVAPVTIARRERTCSLLDDQTVTLATPAAGDGMRVYDVTTEGVWVEALIG